MLSNDTLQELNQAHPYCPLQQTVNIQMNTTAAGTLTATDSQGKPLIFEMITPPLNGSASIDYSTGLWSYIPDHNYTGIDIFTIEVKNTNSEICQTVLSINVLKVDVLLKKETNSVKVAHGDTFIYTITAKNTGTSTIVSSMIYDIMPPQFILKELNLNGEKITGDLSSGVDIGSLNEGEIKTLIVKVKVIGSFAFAPYTNAASGTFKAAIDPSMKLIEINKYATDKIGITVISPKLTLIKSVNKTSTAVGEIISYTIAARNDGNVELSNVTIRDILSSELSFISHTLAINGKIQEHESIIKGINIGVLNIDETKTISFDAKVIAQGNGTIINTSKGNFNYCTDILEPILYGTAKSNQVGITVKRPHLHIEKSVNTDLAILGSSLFYTVILKNDGDLDALDVIFKDTLPDTVQLIDGTFSVNGNIINGVNLKCGLDINDIKVDEIVEIKYQVKVISTNCKGLIINIAKACFGYKTTEIGSINRIESECCSSESVLAISMFKQISIENTLNIPCQKPDIEQINDLTGMIDITNCYIIETAKGLSIEGQNLTGHKLVVHGILNLVIDYTADVLEQNVHSAHYSIPFSTFIVLPPGFESICQSNVRTEVEAIYFKQVSNRSFFSNASVLIMSNIR